MKFYVKFVPAHCRRREWAVRATATDGRPNVAEREPTESKRPRMFTTFTYCFIACLYQNTLILSLITFFIIQQNKLHVIGINFMIFRIKQLLKF